MKINSFNAYQKKIERMRKTQSAAMPTTVQPTDPNSGLEKQYTTVLRSSDAGGFKSHEKSLIS